jgi:alpha-mannosidase
MEQSANFMSVIRRQSPWVRAVGFLLLASPAPSLVAATETIWQIGAFDESSAEFTTHRDAATGKFEFDYSDPAKDPVFVVGKSEAAKDWLPFQPGTSNGRTGYRRHPFTIRFDLRERPVGSYTLDLALLAYSPRLPWIEVALNGHRAWVYQHPKLAYSAGDQWVFYLPYYSAARIRCELPAQYLVKGQNTLVLTALDEPGPRDDGQPSGFPWPGTSGIVYDALALEHAQNERSRPAISTTVVPTIYYKKQGGQLCELVDVFVRSTESLRRATATLTLGRQNFFRTLNTDREFGEAKFEFEIPESAWNNRGEVAVDLDGRSQETGFQAIPAKKWTVFVAPNVHLDVGYSDYDSKVAEIHTRAVDEAIAMIRENPSFRFNLDGSWIVEQFLNGRSEQQRNRFLQLVKEHKLLIPAAYSSNFTGFATIENLIRSLYYSKSLARENGTAFDFSLINDVPSYSWSYASVMAAAGLNYFVAASDAYRAPFLLFNRFNEMSPQWWQGPDGSRILTWYSRHYHQMASMFGLPPQVAVGHDALVRFLQAYERPEYKADAVILFGTQVENTDLFPQQAKLVDEWNRAYEYPKLQYSGFPEAMAYIAAQMGDSVPVVRGDGGPYWEDGMIADAHLTEVARESEHRILSAEKFATISTLVNTIVRPDRERIERAWRKLLLIDEHSWDADRSVTDPESEQSIRQGADKDSNGSEAQRGINSVLGRALSAIADYIDSPKGTLVVFNPLAWKRSELVEVDVDKGLAPFDLLTEREVPFEILSSGRSFQHIRFLAENIPSVGYKSFALRPGQSQALPAAPQGAVENQYYRLALDTGTGAVRSIFDKELNRELVDTNSALRFDQYLYVTGADELPNRLVQYSTVSPIPKLELHPATGGHLLSVTRTPFGVTARLEALAVNTPHIETEIRLFDGQKKIEFVNRIRKEKVYSKEAAYFAFPLAMQQPRFRYETQNGFVDPSRDLLPGAGLEWFNVQHWLAAEEDGTVATIVPIDAPMVTLGDIARGVWPEHFEHRNGTVYSYIMSNYTPEGYPAGQGGDFTFRYVLTSSGRFDPVANGGLGWAATSPLELDEIRPNDKAVSVPRPLAASHGSFLNIDQPDLTLITWKMAEDGKGTILRLLETGGRNATATVHVPLLDISGAWKCNAVEDDQQALEFNSHDLRVVVKPFEIVTIRVQGATQH